MWSLPTESPFCSLTGLASLNLSGNSLSDVSELGFAPTNELGSCALPLTDLDLSRNSIERLDRESFGRLSKLERLDVSGNAISAVEGSALDGLPALKTLRLASNRLRALPSDLFRGSKDLRELHLQNNSLAALAADLFSGLRHLVVLNVSQNALSSDALSGETFGALLRLVALDMSGNGLTGLPAGLLSPLTSLQLLDLSGNALREVGSGAFSSQYNLHSLVLDGNGIERLRPGSFNGLSVLGSLSLAGNALGSLEADVTENLTSLEELDLSGNEFSKVPSGALLALTRLRRLNLRGNSISDLSSPEALSGLGSVRELTLADNGVEKVAAVVFASTPNLVVLDLSRNKIKQLDQGVFGTLRNLRALRLHHNVLDDINGILAGQTDLKELNVSSNLLQWFDYAFIPKNLHVLDISHNRIEELGNYYKLEGGFKLRTIRAEGNRIKGLRSLSLPSSVEWALLGENRIRVVEPGSFAEKENLTSVDLRGNLLRQLELSAIAVKSAAAGSAGKCGRKNKQTKMPPCSSFPRQTMSQSFLSSLHFYNLLSQLGPLAMTTNNETLGIVMNVGNGLS